MSNKLETIMGAFEERMALRHRMMSVMGARFPNVPRKPFEDLMRESVIRCFECSNGNYCATWLEAVDPDVSPSDCCPAAETHRQIVLGQSTNC